MFLWFVVMIGFTGVGSEDLDRGMQHDSRYSLDYPYYLDGSNQTIPFFDKVGTVKYLPDMVQLTSGSLYEQGAIWAQTPNDLEEWQVVIGLDVDGDEVGGEGLAFWYTKERGATGHVFGSKDVWTGLGIFLDSFDDDKKGDNPAVLAVYNHGNYEYNYDRDGEGHVFARCFKEYRNGDYPVSLKIVHRNRTLTVEVDTSGSGEYEECIRYEPIQLPKGYYFGISAAGPDIHNIHSMSVYRLNAPVADQAKHTVPDEKTVRERNQQEFEKQKERRTHLSPVDMHNLKRMVVRIEELQFRLWEKMANFSQVSLDEGAVVKSINSKLQSLDQLAKNNNIKPLTNTVGEMSKRLERLDSAVQKMAGTVEKLLQNQAGTVLSSRVIGMLEEIRDSSLPKSHLMAQQMHESSQEDIRTLISCIWIFAGFQMALVCMFVLWKTSPNWNSPNKKFI